MSLILLSKKGSSVWEGFYNFCRCLCTNWSCLLVSGNRWCCPLFGNRHRPAFDAESLGRVGGNKLHLCFALGLVFEIGFVPNREGFCHDLSHFLTSLLVNDLHLMQFLQSTKGESWAGRKPAAFFSSFANLKYKNSISLIKLHAEMKRKLKNLYPPFPKFMPELCHKGKQLSAPFPAQISEKTLALWSLTHGIPSMHCSAKALAYLWDFSEDNPLILPALS